MDSVDVVVIGGGQVGLSAGCFLRRSGLSYVIVDAETSLGGAWQHAWKSLHLFLPAGWSSIVSKVTETTWITQREPAFLADDSATLIGMTRYAREAARQISEYVGAVSPLPSGP